MTDRDELIDEGVNELVRVLRLTGYDGVQPGNGTDAVGSYRYITFHHPTLDGEIRLYSPNLILFRVNPSKRKNHLCGSLKAAMKYIKEELPKINVYKPA